MAKKRYTYKEYELSDIFDGEIIKITDIKYGQEYLAFTYGDVSFKERWNIPFIDIPGVFYNTVMHCIEFFSHSLFEIDKCIFQTPSDEEIKEAVNEFNFYGINVELGKIRKPIAVN